MLLQLLNLHTFHTLSIFKNEGFKINKHFLFIYSVRNIRDNTYKLQLQECILTIKQTVLCIASIINSIFNFNFISELVQLMHWTHWTNLFIIWPIFANTPWHDMMTAKEIKNILMSLYFSKKERRNDKLNSRWALIHLELKWNQKSIRGN